MKRSLRHHGALLKILLPATVAGLFIGFAFVFFFTSALHDPKPDGMTVGIIGPAAARAKVQSALEQAMPGGIELRTYASAHDAREATREQEVNGAFVADPAKPTLITAGALGSSVNDVLHAAFGGAVAAQGQRLTVEDLSPAPAHDARGISAFFVVAGTTIGSLVFSVALYFLGGHGGFAPFRVRLAVIAAFAVVAGLVVAADTEWVANGLGGAFLEVAGIVALLAASIALATAAVARWLGAPGLGLCALFFMLFSLPASGGAVGPEFVPTFYHSVAPALPSHAALQALKGVVYFEGGGVLGPLLILLAWVGGALFVHLVARLLRHAAPHPPVIGTLPDLRLQR